MQVVAQHHKEHKCFSKQSAENHSQIQLSGGILLCIFSEVSAKQDLWTVDAEVECCYYGDTKEEMH